MPIVFNKIDGAIITELDNWFTL